jgi:TRAP transporter TAXI family solute receptor
MRQPLSRLLRNWFAWLMALVLVASLAIWFSMRVTLPKKIRIGTAISGGLYYEEGLRVAAALRLRRPNHEVRVVETSGSRANAERLRAGTLDVAIVQAGSVSLSELAIVTPLHHDVVHVIVRKELLDNPAAKERIDSISDFAGRQVIVGLPGSGMQHSAREVLEHYNVWETAQVQEVHFPELLNDPDKKYAGAIVTSGVENEDIRLVLETGEFGLLPLDAKALSKRFRHFQYYEIPKNLWPPVPPEPIPTVTTSALVVVHKDASPQLVTLLLDSIFEDSMPQHFSTMFLPQQARDLSPARLHPVTRRYHDPFGRYGMAHLVLEGLAAGKELLFALGAAIYLIWDRWRRLKERENRELVKAQKNRLDAYLERTLDIERVQMDVVDPQRLQKFLDDVTEIKLQALEKLTHEDLRGDRAFAIFLMQCANLISKIQLKIINYTKNI